MHQQLRTTGTDLDLFDLMRKITLWRGIKRGKMRGSQYRRQNTVEVMRDPPGEQANRLDLLGANHLFAGFKTLGDVFANS